MTKGKRAKGRGQREEGKRSTSSFIFLLLLLILGLFSLFLLPSSFFPLPSYAISAQLDELQKQIDDLSRLRQLSEDATTPLEAQLKDLDAKIASAQKGIDAAVAENKRLEKELDQRQTDMAVQYKLLSARIRSFYKRSYLASPFLLFLASDSSGQLTRDLSYRASAAQKDRQIIADIALESAEIENTQKSLAARKSQLESLQAKLDTEAGFFRGEVKKAKDYQASLSGQIADLTAKQQEILSARSGQFIASIGDSELADDVNASIRGFRENAPSGSFAVFSFGGYTHRKGMSQYGARGRAQSGQDFKTILKAYYGKEPVNKDTSGNINVSGYGSMNFEEKYLYGIAEMPSSWHSEALKAQAVAARTYAYRFKTQGSSICITEYCQVFSKSKSDNPPQAWKDAVDATKGQVVEDVVTYYASTHGGFASPIGWDTTDGSGGGNFTDKAYDKLGGSPWLYKAWYTQGYNINSDKCGRSNPWLNDFEMADIVNAALVLTKGSSEEASRITPISSCWGGNPYSHDELRNIASKYGGISSAVSVTVTQSNGSTSQVTINGLNLSGADFKKAFNLRAPGRLSIPQKGFAFFNIEKK